MNPTNTALTPTGQRELNNITALQTTLDKVRRTIDDIYGVGGKLREWDLKKITVPAGAANAPDQGLWMALNETGEPISLKSFRAVVLFSKNARNYWKRGLDLNAPPSAPDCHSDDLVHGVGDPGGDCETCPFAQWGSDNAERGQACKQSKQLFIMRAGSGSDLPEVLSIPASSLAAWQKFQLTLGTRKAISGNGALIEFSLKKTTPKQGGLPYYQVAFQPVMPLPDEVAVMVQKFADFYRPMMTTPAPIAAPTEEAAKGGFSKVAEASDATEGTDDRIPF